MATKKPRTRKEAALALKKRNAQDATLINTRKLARQFLNLQVRVEKLEQRMDASSPIPPVPPSPAAKLE